MIATILKSSSSFSAVRYNERKVENGVAELVAIRNFGYLQDLIEPFSNLCSNFLGRTNQSCRYPLIHSFESQRLTGDIHIDGDASGCLSATLRWITDKECVRMA